MIRYSCHSENFGIHSAEHTFSMIQSLGFDCIDIASRSMIPQRKIIAAPDRCAQTLSTLSGKHQLPLSELFLSDIEVRQIPVSPVSTMAQTHEYLHNFDIICSFAKKAGFASVMGSAGTILPDFGFQKSFELAALALNKQVDIAAHYGLAFHVEPSRLSLLNTVDAALEMIVRAPGLRYTMDFLHFHVNGIPLSQSIKLLPVSGHLHARQAIFPTGKCDFSLGEIDYPRIVSALKKLHWNGDIAMEFWCTDAMCQQGIQAVEENIVMRYYLKSLFSDS